MDYQRIYDQIITRAKLANRKKVKGGEYYEEHHIIPKCLGGHEYKVNRVLLTAREHYVCHKLLVEIYPNNIKLNYSLWMMSVIKLEGRDYYVSSREFERLKLIISKEMSISMSGENNYWYGRNKEEHPMFGKSGELSPVFGFIYSKEECEKRSNRMKLNNPMKEFVITKEFIDNLSKLATERYNKNVENNEGKYIGGKGIHCFATGKKPSKESNEKRRLKQSGENGYWTGKKLPEEHCNNMKLAAKNRPFVTCPYCQFIAKSGGNMTRHHFDNCKMKPKN